MMRMTLVAVAFSIAGAVAAAAAPPVQIAIQDGRVWLKADGATVADVLREWARVGGTAVIDGERLPRTLVSLHLEGEPEQEALEILLRGVGGFVTVGRAAARVDTGASRFERIVVVPSTGQPAANFAATPAMRATSERSTAPVAPVPAPVYTASGAQRVIGPDGLLVPDDQEDAPPVRATPTSIPPGFSPPSGGPTPGATQPTPPPPGVITPPRPGPSVPPPVRRR